MHIHQLYTESQLRNFTYLIELNDKSALVLDPWDEKQVNGLLKKRGLSLRAIINTHEHWDHVQGNQALVEQHGCEVWAHENGRGKIPGLTRTLTAHQLIGLEEGIELKVLDTPGHTFAHLCFVLLEKGRPHCVFSGDTLFNAGVGNCHNGGDPEVLYQTICEQFQVMDDQVIVYPGHEYLQNNLRFTLDREPSNVDAKEWLERAKNANPAVNPMITKIADEKKINTFLRLKSAEIRQRLEGQADSDKQVFLALRSLRNNW